MEILRKLRFLLYPCAFMVVFLLGAYCTFPHQVVREIAESSIMNIAMGMGPRTRGLPEITIKDASLWRLSGVQLDDLKIIWPPKKTTDLPITVELNSLKGRLGIWSFLTGSRSISGYAELYDGHIEGDFKMRQKNVLGYVYIDSSKINLAKMAFIEAAIGAPLQGIFSLVVDVNANSELSKDGTGTIKLNLDNLAYGPGNINLPAGGFVSSLTVPKINMGKLVADFALDKGQFVSKAFSLAGGDLEADLDMVISLGRGVGNSRINGDGWFSFKRDFVNANETIKMLFDLIPELQTAQQGDGKVGLSIRGTLARPMPRLQRYTGQKKDLKKEPVVKKEQ